MLLDVDPSVDPNGLTNTHGVVDEVVDPSVFDIVDDAIEKLVGIEKHVIEGTVESPMFKLVGDIIIWIQK